MFYERFIQLCDENSEKPTNVLKAIGASSGNLKNWKAGASVKSDILMQISEHFNVSIDYLLGKTDTPNSKESINNQNTTINGGVQAVKSPVTIGTTLTEIQFDEMTAELIRAFQSMSFVDKMEVMNAVLKKTKMKGNG
ncbi:MAG: helix-turn-helix domain containing protein [Oscillospiraceae bacterium]|nr:helix-turn-helix domain containing protein [Oscillospiraceae bacterium]